MSDITIIRLLGRTLAINWELVRKSIPTVLSMSRVLSPVYLVPLIVTGHPFAFTLVASAAALTDWLDGALARRWNVATQRGAELDIYGDKVLCCVLLGAGLTSLDGWSHIAPTLILVLYHTVVIVVRVVGDLLFKSSRIAKLKMFFEMPALIASATYLDAFGLAWVNDLGMLFLWMTTVLATWSMLHYLYPLEVPDWPEKFWPRKSL